MSNKNQFSKKTSIEEYRYKMVLFAKNHGISATSREYKADRKTIRKWYKVYINALAASSSYDEILSSLKNKSRMGQFHPKKLSYEDEKKIIELRGTSNIGAYFIKDSLGLSCSLKTIHKKLVQNGKIGKQKKKPQKKRDMAEMRKNIKPFQKLQIDVKYLCDIPNIYPGYLHGIIPKYQITVRDYKTGFTMIGFTYSKDSTSIGIFVSYVLDCLKKSNIDLSNTHFQSDNGSEFRSVKKKYGHSFYEEILIKNNIKYRFIPPAKPTFNSDVESFHKTIERESYDIEEFGDTNVFLDKLWVYITWYNLVRKNRNKQNKAPLTLIKEYYKNNYKGYNNIDSLIKYPPIIVDGFVKDIELIKKGGEVKWLSPT
jgi:hypothetical protein